MISEEKLKRKRRIAERLVAIETQTPGAIRLYPNPERTANALELLGELGYRKPFFTSGSQFAMDCFLTYPNACDHLLPYCMLVCAEDHSRHYIYNGYGVLRKCFPTLPRFEGNESIIYAVNIAPIISALTDLLEVDAAFKAAEEERVDAYGESCGKTIRRRIPQAIRIHHHIS